MRKLLLICMCAVLSVSVAMADHHAEKKKMESTKKHTKPLSVDGVGELKKGDAKLRKLVDQEDKISAQCCGTPSGDPEPKPKPVPEPPAPDCEEGLDPDCDDDDDVDRDVDTDGPATMKAK